MTASAEQNTPRPAGRVPVDFEAILASMQDQIEDLTAVVEAHQRRLDELDKARKG